MSERTVLVIDDSAAVHASVEDALRTVVDRTLHAPRPSEGLRIAIQQKPDAILLDINMPEMDGYKVCRNLKENSGTRDIPVLFLTSNREIHHLARALDCGGSDYILKPFHAVELEARVRASLRTKRTLDLLKEQARFDTLTGLNNRAALDAALDAASSAYRRSGQPVGLLMVDLDHFKEINDEHGHGVGDELLREIGAAIRTASRPYDVACRFGGDEFTVILGHTGGKDAHSAATRILSAIRDARADAGSKSVSTSASAGLATTAVLSEGFEAADLLKAADAALYQAKRAGRGVLVEASAELLPAP
jgi:diguanylate cyclase (GGDEF)-like protein